MRLIMDQKNINVNDPEFQTSYQYYRIYRHLSAILLIIAYLHTGKRYGRGWRPYYEYAQMNSEDDEYGD